MVRVLTLKPLTLIYILRKYTYECSGGGEVKVEWNTYTRSSTSTFKAEASEVEQSIDLSWLIPEDYDANNEARLLRHGNAAQETVINSTRCDLDNEDSRCNARFSKIYVLLDTYEWEKFTEIEPHMMSQFFYDSSKEELSIRNMCKTDDITDDVTILYHWEYSKGLSSPMGSMIAAAVLDPMRNGDNFIKTITLPRDYRTCTLNRYDVEAIFYLKPIVNYRLEIMRLSGFKEFYHNIIECVIMQKSKREEI
ncbi:hypothetical protein FQA39_LY02356 [Lamprigera yunnana]|nr:hypothetical protein FQA39_LY02356 [Lamprigera yunnana]